MKKISHVIIILVCGLLTNTKLSAQCGSKKFVDSCSAFPKECVFSKARVVQIKNKKDLQSSVYSVMLTKGTTYIITICEANASNNDGKMVVNLLDSKDHLIMSNWNNKTNKYYSKITFNCNASGTYYLGYLFNGERARVAE